MTLGVRALGRSRHFYEALGCTTHAKPDDDVVFFQTGSSIVGLWDRAKLAEDSGLEDGGGWGGVTLAHNARSPMRLMRSLSKQKEPVPKSLGARQ